MGRNKIEVSEFDKDKRDLKKAIDLEMHDYGVYVVAVAVSKFYDENEELQISATFGTPLNHEVHNMVNDCFHVEGVATHIIGHVPVCYVLSIADTMWSTEIPLPFPVLRRYMSKSQKDLYEEWQLSYKKDHYDIIYLQMLSSYKDLI